MKSLYEMVLKSTEAYVLYTIETGMVSSYVCDDIGTVCDCHFVKRDILMMYRASQLLLRTMNLRNENKYLISLYKKCARPGSLKLSRLSKKLMLEIAEHYGICAHRLL